MAYVSDSNLTQFWGLAKGYIKAEDSRYANWQKTEKAGAVTCWPVGGTPLLPTVDFLFTETGPASGDKGPENPSTISGVSSVNVGRIGKNLLLQASGSPSRYTVVRNADGSLSISGSGSAIFQVTDSGAGTTGPYSSCRLNLNKQYTLSVEVVSGSLTDGTINIAQSVATQRSVSIPASGKSSITFTPSDAGYVDGRFVCRMLTGSSSVATNTVLKIQLEEGSTATDFEAPMLPADANHDIPLGSTYYGGEIDLATGLMTVTHEGVVIPRTNIENTSGTESSGVFNLLVYDLRTGGKQANVFSYNESSGYNSSNYFCNYYPWERSGAVANTFHVSANFAFLSIPGSSVENARQNLLAVYDAAVASGNPISFVYPLATPYTVQLSPTQILSLTQTDKYTPRLNTVYTDASAVQVGYAKSPIRSEYELIQAIIATEGGE